MLRLAHALSSALAAGNPELVVTSIVASAHRSRLQRLYLLLARRFLEAFEESRVRPHSRYAKLRCERAKAMLDLTKARISTLGSRKPADRELIDVLREADMPRVVHRKAA